jgi:hypothetical protein
MPDVALMTDLFEMVAALAALLVTAILFRETNRMRDEVRDMRSEMLAMRDEVVLLRSKLQD